MEVFFIYKNKAYPFDISLFIKYSHYMYSQYEEIRKNKTKYIYLISEFDNISELQDESIKKFIDYCQAQKIKLSISDVIQIKFLSYKYDVPTLIEKTEKYIKKHYKEIINDLFSKKLNDITSLYIEDIILYRISSLLTDKRLLDIPVSCMYRIFNKYSAQHKNNVENYDFPFIVFLTKYIQKHGPETSFLLSFFDIGPKSCEYLIEKLSENSKLVDSEYSKLLMFRSIHFMNIKQKEKDHLNDQKLKVENIKSNCFNVFNEILNTELFQRNNLINEEKNFSLPLMKYGIIYTIRSVFNKISITEEESIDEHNDQNNSFSKYDVLNELLKCKFFSKSSSILLGNKEYLEIISHVSQIRSKQTKRSIINLFKLIESKNDSIESVNKIFPYFYFKKSELSMLTFWIPLTKELIENNIYFSIIIDNEEFVFNQSSLIDCKVVLIMNEKGNLKLSEGSQIQFPNSQNKIIQLNDINDILIYYTLLELAKRKMKTVTPMDPIEIFHVYYLTANKKFLNRNENENHFLSIKDLFEKCEDSILSICWNLVFSLSEIEIHEISSLINPIESQLLLSVYKIFKISNFQNINDFFEWNKWAEQIDIHINTINNCFMELNPQYEDISNDEIDLLLNDLIKGIEYLKNEPILSNYDIEISKKYLEICEIELDRFLKIKEQKTKIYNALNELINSLMHRKVPVENEKMRDEIIRELKNIKIYSDNEFLNSNNIITQYIKYSQSLNCIETEDPINWPNIESNESDTENENIQLFNSLIFYSKVKSLLKGIQDMNTIIINLTKLNNFSEMSYSNKLFLSYLVHNFSERNYNNNYSKFVSNSWYTLQANMIMKLYNNNNLFIINNEYLCNSINIYANRNQCDKREIKWMNKAIKELSSNFLLTIPKFEPNSLVFLIINQTNNSDNGYVPGPLFADISDLNMDFIVPQCDLMLSNFISFHDAAKSIAQVFYNSIISSDEIPPENYQKLKDIYNESIVIDEQKIQIIEKLKILFVIAESLDNWKEPNLDFQDTLFLSMKWKDLIINEDLLNNYPSFLFWICQNKECINQIISNYKNYKNFSSIKNKIPLWLVYLRIISSNQCIQFDTNKNTKTSNIVNKAIKNEINIYLTECKEQNRKINYNWINILTSNLPKKIKNNDIALFHDFLNHLSVDNFYDQSEEIQENKANYINQIASELTSLIISNNYHNLFNQKLSQSDSLARLICYPSKYIKEKIKEKLPEKIKEKLFKIHYNIINILRIEKSETIDPIKFKFNDINNQVLTSPIFYISLNNEIKCTTDNLLCKIGPIFPSLLESDKAISINIASLIDKKVNISLEDVENPHKIEIYLPSNEKIMNKNPIQILIKPPVFKGNKKEIVNIKGNLIISANRINPFLLPFTISMMLLPIKVKLRCIQYQLSEIKKNVFRLCCDSINSDETFDIELVNYYNPELFIIGVELGPFGCNQANKPIVQINESTKSLSITVPHSEKLLLCQFDLIIKLSRNFETRIRCDFLIRPLFFIFEVYDYCLREFVSDSCQLIIHNNKELTQKLQFRLVSLYQFKQKAKLTYKLPNCIKIEGSSIENDNFDNFEINGNSSFFITFSSNQKLDFSGDEYYITIEICQIKKTIQLTFINTIDNLIGINNEYLSMLPCYLYDYDKEKWERIASIKEIPNNKYSPFPYIFVDPFQSFATINNFITINYHKEGFNYVTTLNSTELHVSYIQISLEDKTIKYCESAKNEIKIETKKEYLFLSSTKRTSYYSLIGYIKEDPNNWFPVFNEYPKLDSVELLPYNCDKENISKANHYLEIIYKWMQSQDIENEACSRMLIYLLVSKDVVLRINDIIKSFPPVLQNKFVNILNDIDPYISLGDGISDELSMILSNNLIITFINVFEERYKELESYQFCLQMNVSKSTIQKRIDESFTEFMHFSNEMIQKVNNDINNIFDSEYTKIEDSLFQIARLPRESQRSDCILINENKFSKPCKLTKVFANDSFDMIFKDKSFTKSSLPVIDLPIGDSLSSYMSFISSCSEGSMLLPTFVYCINYSNFEGHEKYFNKLFKIFIEVSCKENKSILSMFVNNFIESFKTCVRRLKIAGFIFDDENLQLIANECNFQYQQLISIPKFDLPSIETIEWWKDNTGDDKLIVY